MWRCGGAICSKGYLITCCCLGNSAKLGPYPTSGSASELWLSLKPSLFSCSAVRYGRIIGMRSAVILAWQHDVAASVAACSESTPQRTGRKRSRLCEATASSNQQSTKRRRVALSSITANPRNMSVPTKDRSPSKRTRASSPRKRGNNVSDAEELEILPTQSHPPTHHFDPPSFYQEALAAEYDESEAPQRRSPSRRAQTESDAPSTSKRSASPVKRVAALQDVGSGIFYQELSDNGAELGTGGQELFWLLQDSSLGIAALPAALEPELLPELGRNRPFQMDTLLPNARLLRKHGTCLGTLLPNARLFHKYGTCLGIFSPNARLLRRHSTLFDWSLCQFCLV